MDPIDQARASRIEAKHLVLRSSGEIHLVPFGEIAWIEADGDYLHVHTSAKRHLMRLTMREAERRLDQARFLRIHRSIIVNLDCVEKFCLAAAKEKVAVLRDGTRLKLAASACGRVKEVLSRN